MNTNKIIMLMVVMTTVGFASGYFTKSRLVHDTYPIVQTDIGDFIIKDRGLYRLSKLQSEESTKPMTTAFKKETYGYPR